MCKILYAMRVRRKTLSIASGHIKPVKNWLTDIADRVGSIVKNQKQSSYCWIHAPVRAMELGVPTPSSLSIAIRATYW